MKIKSKTEWNSNNRNVFERNIFVFKMIAEKAVTNFNSLKKAKNFWKFEKIDQSVFFSKHN